MSCFHSMAHNTVKPEILAAIIFSVLLRLNILASVDISVLQVVVTSTVMNNDNTHSA